MAHSNSAKKRIRQNAKRKARNRWRKSVYREEIKQYEETILHGTVDKAEEQLQGLYKTLDRTAAKGAIHRNTAARYKSRLTDKLNQKRAAA